MTNGMTGLWADGRRYCLREQGNYAMFVLRPGDDKDIYGYVDTEDEAQKIAQGWNKDHESRTPNKMEYQAHAQYVASYAQPGLLADEDGGPLFSMA